MRNASALSGYRRLKVGRLRRQHQGRYADAKPATDAAVGRVLPVPL